MKKGVNFLEVLFLVLFFMKITEALPVVNWSWFKIFLPLIIDRVVRFCVFMWLEIGFNEYFKAAVLSARYDLKLKGEVKKAKYNLRRDQKL